jgi:hypothetical protein
MAAKNQDDPVERRRRQVEDQRKAIERSNAEAMARMEETQPTPTQAENDMAKLGVGDIDEKEDHGGEDEGEALRRQMVGRLSPDPYVTRDVSAAGGEEHFNRRREAKKAGGRKSAE